MSELLKSITKQTLKLVVPPLIIRTKFGITGELTYHAIVKVYNNIYCAKKRNNIVWKVAKNGSFTVKENFIHLERVNHPLVPVKLLWNSCIPTKVSFFTWEVWWDKMLTMDQLKRRGHYIASKCPFCRKNEEALEHLLVHCPMIWGFWAALTSITRANWACPLAVKDLLLCWSAFPVRKHARKIWKAAPLSLIWQIGKERNKIVFEDATFSYNRLKLSFILAL